MFLYFGVCVNQMRNYDFSNEFYLCMCIQFYIDTSIQIDSKRYHFIGKEAKQDIMQWNSMSLIYFSMDLGFDQMEENILTFSDIIFYFHFNL